MKKIIGGLILLLAIIVIAVIVMPISDNFYYADTLYTVNFYNHDGTYYRRYFVAENETIDEEELNEPTKQNQIFVGWYLDEDFVNPFDASLQINLTNYSDTVINVYPKFVNENVNISFDIPTFNYEIDGVSHIFEASKNAVTVKYNTTLTPLSYEYPEIQNHTFIGWYLDENYQTELTTLNALKDTTLFAKYEPSDMAIAFIYGEDFETILNVTTPFGTMPTPPDNLDYGYYKFIGWNNEVVIAYEDAEYLAIYEDTEIHKYMADGEIIDSSKRALTNPTKPPEKEGYTFGGYALESSLSGEFIYNAVYLLNSYEISVNASNCNVNCVESAYYGESITLKLILDEGYILSSVKINNKEIIEEITDNSYTFIAPASKITIKVVTEEKGITETTRETESPKIWIIATSVIVVVSCGVIIFIYFYKKKKEIN